MDKGIIEALREYIDRHFEYEYCLRQPDEEGHGQSCIKERKAVEEAWQKVISKEKPPLLTGDEIDQAIHKSPAQWQISHKPIALEVAQAQWDICVKHYEGGK